jgi:DNA adenine methylase
MKPILKWVGGKTQIIDKVLSKFPTYISGNYIEPFLGGGSVLLAVLTASNNNKIQISGSILASDINETLIALYNFIKQDPQLFYDTILPYIQSYNSKSTPDEQEIYYYECRSEFNALQDKTSLQAAVLFLFLNKTCFRGLWREGPNGFNVPFGHYKNPEIVSLSTLQELHTLIQPVTFVCQNYINVLSNVSANDFIYLDPPYVPEKKSSFTRYSKCDFNDQEHVKLFNLLNNCSAKFVMSNSDSQLVQTAFNDITRFNIEIFSCKRAINSKKPNAVTNEVFVSKIN